MGVPYWALLAPIGSNVRALSNPEASNQHQNIVWECQACGHVRHGQAFSGNNAPRGNLALGIIANGIVTKANRPKKGPRSQIEGQIKGPRPNKAPGQGLGMGP